MPEIIIESRRAALSTGMEVKRILPFRKRRMVGPFIFMDHAGPVTDIPKDVTDMDVLPHPHIGLSTVTYLFGGSVTHRDSLGVEQIIKPGEVNWMTAGKGISHSERFDDPTALAGGNLEMLQTWVALPERNEEDDPSFNSYHAEQLPIYTDKNIWMRLVAGNAYGLGNDVKTLSPLFYIHVVLEPGGKLSLPKGYEERGIYIVRGSIDINHQNYEDGQLLVFSKNDDPIISTSQNSVLMMLGGDHLGDRHIWWNFVSSKKERIEQAKEDWKQGRFKLPHNDDKEFVPLPESPLRTKDNPSPNALS